MIAVIVALYGSSGSRAPAAPTAHGSCTKTLSAGAGSLSRFVQRLHGPGRLSARNVPPTSAAEFAITRPFLTSLENRAADVPDAANVRELSPSG